MSRFGASLLALGISLTVAPTAMARTADANSQAADDQPSGGIEDIVVTAQRREERLQDVPVAVQALSANALEQKGVSRTFDLPNAVPGLSVNRAANTLVYFLRGVGNSSQVAGSDPSIATYIDGIYQAFPNGAMLTLNNVERIEVLKGPQGTLFGRNATGGLIQIVTRTPKNDFTADLKVGYDTFDTVSGSTYVSGGSGIVAADLAISYSKQHEGWGRNLFTPDQAGTVTFNGVPIAVPDVPTHEAGINEDFAIGSKIVISPSDALTIKLAAAYARNRSDQGLYRNYLPGTSALIIQSGVTQPYRRQGGFWDWNSNARSIGTNKQSQFSADVAYEAGSVTFKSLTAYIDASSDTYVYSPAQPKVESPGTPQYAHSFVPVKAFSQEFQVSSATGGPLQWIVGAYYSHNKTGVKDLEFLRGNFLDRGIRRHGPLTTESFAGFAQATYEITDDTRITGGLRYTKDKLVTSQVYEGTTLSTIPATPAQNASGVRSNVVPEQKASFDNLSYRVALDHHFTPDVMVFASMNTGYKAGGFNTGTMCTITIIGNCPAANIASPVKPEKLTAYEVGFKTDLFDRKVRFNASAFYYDYKNLQVITLTGTPIVSLLQNAAKARIKGIDAELEVAPVRNLTLSGAIEILDAKYLDFPSAAAFAPRNAAPFGNATVVLPNAKGNYLSRAPKFSSTMGATYTVPLESGEISFNTSYTYNGGFYWEVSNRLKQKAYGVLNAEIAFSPNDYWSARLWGRNITNKKYYTFVDAAVYGDRAAAGAPATFGVTLNYKYR
jgi:iron complex outermembrane receptor protein